MKKLPYAPLIALSTALSVSHASADPKVANDIQRATTFTATTIAGAIAGGPVGMIIGAIGGAYLSEQSKKAVASREQLEEAELAAIQLEETLILQQDEIVELENRIAKKLEFQVMFPTGEDQLSFQDSQRVKSLAKYLNKNPQLKIRLDGHADPRGTDEYNNVLSSERAKSVEKTLLDHGIDANRIDLHFHGSSFATTLGADRDQYALERRVHIEVFSDISDEMAVAN